MGKFYNNIIKDIADRAPYELWPIDVDDVRQEWKDTDDLHEIFSGLTTDEDYQRCMLKAILDFNEALPTTEYSPVGFPFPHLWIKKAFVEVMDELIMYHTANQFSGSSGGVQVPVHERVQMLIPERDRRKQWCEAKQREIKTDLNYQAAWGGIVGSGGYGSVYG